MKPHLVLVGGGHAHVIVLRRLMMAPVAAELTLVSDAPSAIYSGMVPGCMAGQYDVNELEIDLVPLARRAGARVILESATAIDAKQRRVQLAERSIAFDLLSIDVGSSVRGLDTPGVMEHAIPTRPIAKLVSALEAVLKRARCEHTQSVVVVGAGAGGVEIAFAMEARLRNLKVEPRVTLLDAGERILSEHPTSFAQRAMEALKKRNINVLLNSRVSAVHADSVDLQEGNALAADCVFWAAGAAAPSLFRDTDLLCDERGFVRTRSTLQTTEHDNILAAGDCATLDTRPQLPKAGVYAVRAGAVLDHNLRALLSNQRLRAYRPQQDYLTLLNTGDGSAVGQKRGLSFSGRWAMRLKDRIDRRFVQKFQVLGEDAELREGFEMPAMDADPMLCGGCAAKVGQSVLSRALDRLPETSDDNAIQLGLGDRDDAAAVRTPRGDVLVSSVDAFRAFTDDPYLVGKVAAVNALSDVQAKGALPRWTHALLVVPHDLGEGAEELVYQVLMGMRTALDEADVRLLGGHTTTGPELLVGLSVEGLMPEGREPMKLAGLRNGEHLVLTKALGTGVLLHADMAGRCRGSWFQAAIESMCQDNGPAARRIQQEAVRAVTDVTGFGLAGHLGVMLRQSDVSADLELPELPVLPGALQLSAVGLKSTAYPENSKAIRAMLFEEGLDQEPRSALLFDPQTSGGLLFGIEASRSAKLVEELRALGYLRAGVIGKVRPKRQDEALIRIVRRIG